MGILRPCCALALAAGCWRAPAPEPVSSEAAGSAARPAIEPAPGPGSGPWGLRPPARGGGRDRDGDGLRDGADKCPGDPEDHDAFQDEDGCPDLDNDADGILDVDDLCPNDPEDRDRFQDEDGCPDP